MFSRMPRRAGDPGDGGGTASGTRLDSQETVRVRIDQRLLLKLRFLVFFLLTQEPVLSDHAEHE